MVKSTRIGQSNAAKSLKKKRETFNDYNSRDSTVHCIVYSVYKYWETSGTKDLGENFWNVGKTKEISSRVLHI